TNVRKMRWTWSADLQDGAYLRSEFCVAISNWIVSGTNRDYRVAGTGSRRAETTRGGRFTRRIRREPACRALISRMQLTACISGRALLRLARRLRLGW